MARGRAKSRGAASQYLRRLQAEHAKAVADFIAVGAFARLEWFIQPTECELEFITPEPLDATVYLAETQADGDEDVATDAFKHQPTSGRKTQALKSINRHIAALRRLARAIKATEVA